MKFLFLFELLFTIVFFNRIDFLVNHHSNVILEVDYLKASIDGWDLADGFKKTNDVNINVTESDSLVIVAFGNSITAYRKTIKQVFSQRLPSLLSKHGIQSRVINSGVPGSHTGTLSDNNFHKVKHALDRFHSDVIEHQPGLVIIGFGTNDAHIDSDTAKGSSRIKLGNYRNNLSYMIKTLHDLNIHVVLIAPNLLGESYEHSDLQNARLFKYVSEVRTLANQYEIGLVDVAKIFSDYANSTGLPLDTLLLDGMHPNDLGHQLIAENLTCEIKDIINNANQH